MSATSTNGNQTAEPAAAAADTCVICLDAISERAVTAPCQHDAFDYLCLLNWLEVRQSCPLCNASVEALDVVNKTLGRVVRHPIHPPKPPSPPHNHHHRRHRAPTPPSPSADFAASAIQRRRHIYKHHLRSRHIGSNGYTRFRSATPQHFRRSPALVSRARTFLRRELHVFPWLDGDREYVLEYVTAILKCIDLRGAEGAAEDMIADFVGRRNAQVLVHELYAWVRSPFERLVQFDSFVQYGEVVDAPGVDGGGERGPGDSYRPRYSGLVE
ncbi:RING finger domain protein [Morchella snyderi]|nr:RING finger domain protein [Morchella snyderi]